MAKNQLFPVIDVPEGYRPKRAEEKAYKKSLNFDFRTGDLVRGSNYDLQPASGREAYMQWCVKVVSTERAAHLAYSADIGVELESALSLPDRKAAEAAISRTITEALKVNIRTQYVRGFVFDWRAGELRCTFTVKGRDWHEQNITVTYRT